MNAALSAPRQPPLDVRLMNQASTALLAAALLAALGVVGWWALRNPQFAIHRIAVVGDTVHNNALTLRANVAPKLRGNFFTMDLSRARAAFEAVPWVRHAVVQREFPNWLKVTLQEHQAVAYWGPESESRLLNSYGEVFDANVGDVEQDDLPRLIGPDTQAAQMLAMQHQLEAPFALLDAQVVQLELSTRGSWRASLDNDAVVELGTGSAAEVLARTQRFVRTLTQVSARYGRGVDALQSADLRYPEGYALRLRGVGTVSPDATGKTVGKR